MFETRAAERDRILRAVSAGEATTVRRTFAASIEPDTSSRSLRFTISTGTPDRYDDTVNPGGWDLTMFKRNRVVLWQHDQKQPPIAKATAIWIEGNALKAVAEFAPPELSPFADQIYRMLKAGYLSATSVGFVPRTISIPKDPKRITGLDFLTQELLEFSVCTVPANGEALIDGRAAPDIGRSVHSARLDLLKASAP